MKKLNKLEINSEKLMKNEELVTLRGGYGGSCEPCGSGVQKWNCSVWWNGTYLYGGIACGSQDYILGVYPAGEGYTVECTGGGICDDLPIGH